MSKLKRLLETKDVILSDGAIGTLLYEHGVFINRSFEQVNIINPALVKKIHGEYKEAGSDFITTNTFAANILNLRSYGLEQKIDEINLSGARLAREIAKDDILVAGSIGPLGISTVEPYGTIKQSDAKESFLKHALLLEKGGVDFFILETFHYLHELLFAIDVISAASSLDIIAQLTLTINGTTLIGEKAHRFASALDKSKAIVIGINCSSGPQKVLETVKEIKGYTNKDIIAQPNAGLPKEVDGRHIYLSTPEYFGSYARNFIRAGAKIIGGCCGSTPMHIKNMRASIKALGNTKPHHTKTGSVGIKEHRKKGKNAPILQETSLDKNATKDSLASKSNLARKLMNKEFVTTVEITPPKGPDATKVIEKAKYLKEQGVDAINIPDGPRASSRMSALLLSLLIEQNANIETIMHYTCRDRNILGMQSDLLGAYASGLHNILIITGDPPKMGDYPDASAVFDLDAIGLTKIVSSFNSGLDIGGNGMSKATGYLIGVGVNPTAYDIEPELAKFKRKVDAGAEFAITQPIFDVNVLLSFLDSIKKMNISIPIIAGIWPLVSYRNASFMENEVPGVCVPKEIMQRMKLASDIGKEKALEEGISIASTTISIIKDKVSGVQVSAPFGRVEYAIDVMKDLLPKAIAPSK